MTIYQCFVTWLFVFYFFLHFWFDEMVKSYDENNAAMYDSNIVVKY